MSKEAYELVKNELHSPLLELETLLTSEKQELGDETSEYGSEYDLEERKSSAGKEGQSMQTFIQIILIAIFRATQREPDRFVDGSQCHDHALMTSCPHSLVLRRGPPLHQLHARA